MIEGWNLSTKVNRQSFSVHLWEFLTHLTCISLKHSPSVQYKPSKNVQSEHRKALTNTWIILLRFYLVFWNIRSRRKRCHMLKRGWFILELSELWERFPCSDTQLPWVQSAGVEVWERGGTAGSPGTLHDYLWHYSWLIFYRMCLFRQAIPLSAVRRQANRGPLHVQSLSFSHQLGAEVTAHIAPLPS